MNPNPRGTQSAGPGDSTVGKGVVSVSQGRIFGARWAAGQMKSSVQQGRASEGTCQGDQHGVEQLSGV